MKKALLRLIPVGFALLVACAWWAHREDPSEDHPLRVAERKGNSHGLDPVAPKPDPGVPPAESPSREGAKPASAPFPETTSPPVAKQPYANPWRPGYMGMNGEDFPGGYVLTTQVFAYTAAERAGLRVGDIILEFNGTAVPDLATLFQMARGAGEGAPVSLHIRRTGIDLYLGLQLGRHPLFN